MIEKFILFGLAGWILEIVWTGLHSAMHKDKKLIASTSLWMFPIYGLAVFLGPMAAILSPFPIIIRGGVYALCIFAVEYMAGWGIMKLAGSCPWDYKDCKYSVKGFIRLDYAPVWFCTGLLFELCHTLFNNLLMLS